MISACGRDEPLLEEEDADHRQMVTDAAMSYGNGRNVRVNLYEAFVLWLIVKLLQSDLKGFLTDLHNIHPMFKWNCRIADG